jgi:hypothetical protein
MIPTMMFSIRLLKLLAKAGVEAANHKQRQSQSDVDQVIHNHYLTMEPDLKTW